MTFTFPVLPQGAETTFSLISNAITHRPTMGGPEQRYARLGDRFSIQVQCRSMAYRDGVGIAALLNRAVTEKVRIPVPQPGLDIGSPGSPVIASGAGSTVTINGFSAGYQLRAGQFFSIVHSGVRYLHQVASDVTANSGSATVSILPMLRTTLTAGDVCEFAQPYLEGFLTDNSNTWSFGLTKAIRVSFSVSEAA